MNMTASQKPSLTTHTMPGHPVRHSHVTQYFLRVHHNCNHIVSGMIIIEGLSLRYSSMRVDTMSNFFPTKTQHLVQPLNSTNLTDE